MSKKPFAIGPSKRRVGGVSKSESLAPQIDSLRLYQLRVEQGLTIANIAKIYGVSPQAIHQRLAKVFALLPSKSDVDVYRANRGLVYDAAEMKLMGSIVDSEAIEKASLNNRAYAFSQIHGARRLQAGESTANIAHLHSSDLVAIGDLIKRVSDSLLVDDPNDEDKII
jgi:predicted DNA-binding protein YlxM (UPF0122 family)